jgi:RNA polymerase sigma factor (sigma-70 family)
VGQASGRARRRLAAPVSASGKQGKAGSRDCPQDIPPAVRDLILFKVRRQVARRSIRRQDAEDLEQELIVQLLKRLPALNPNKAASLAYLGGVLDRCLASHFRNRRAKKRSACRTCSLDQYVQGHAGGTESAVIDQHARDARYGRHARAPQELVELSLDISSVLDVMSAKQRDLTSRLLQGKSKSQVARERGVPRSTQANEVRALQALLARVGLRNYL